MTPTYNSRGNPSLTKKCIKLGEITQFQLVQLKSLVIKRNIVDYLLKQLMHATYN